jgi:hypothetical protein
MEIEISIKTKAGYKRIKIKGSMPFEMYGHRFAAHRNYAFPALWNVAELLTGCSVSREFQTRKMAVLMAKKTLETIGKADFKKYVANATQQTGGRN